MIILDTNVVSELIKAHADPRVMSWLGKTLSSDIHTTIITEAELRYGIAILPEGQKKQQLLSSVEFQFANAFSKRTLHFKPPCAAIYAQIMADCRKIGRPIEPLDAQIAAIAKTHNATLATRNTADFEYTGITLINPWTHTP